jgi:pSer/pThr/pTyr-binding forkhead associated (FHA) protein
MPRVTITVPEKTSQPYRFQLDRQVVTLGRGSENDIAIDSGSVSVNHAEMHRVGGGYELRDVGSTNGIKLDGVRHEVIPLTNGKSVKIGDVAFDFLLSDEELAALAGEKRSELPPIVKERDLPAPPVSPRPAKVVIQTQSSSGVGAALLFLILAAAAFFTGLAVRYQKETGGSFLEAIRVKLAAESAPATPTPSATPEAEPDSTETSEAPATEE